MRLPTYSEDVLARAKKIKLLICDVDGVLTDGRLFFTPEGQELKSFHARDGHGIKLLQRAGVEAAVISGRKSPAVALRMSSLGVQHVYQGCEDKLGPFQELLELLQLTPEEVAFVGDDILDLPILRRVGLPISVADGHFTILETAQLITQNNGGAGAVREVCDLILMAKDALESVIQSYH